MQFCKIYIIILSQHVLDLLGDSLIGFKFQYRKTKKLSVGDYAFSYKSPNSGIEFRMNFCIRIYLGHQILLEKRCHGDSTACATKKTKTTVFFFQLFKVSYNGCNTIIQITVVQSSTNEVTGQKQSPNDSKTVVQIKN